MGWFYGEGTRSEEGRREEGGRQNVAQGERERGVGLRGKDFCKCGIGCIFTSDQARQ